MVMGSLRQETEAVVIGAGPGGYVCALRLADLGKEVLLIEERKRPGGIDIRHSKGGPGPKIYQRHPGRKIGHRSGN